MIQRVSIILLVLAVAVTNAYVSSVLPPKKQIQYLKQLTGDICESPAGELSEQMIKAAPQVMKGWSTSKKVTTENAVAVENLIKRLVDESNAGNPKAMPLTTEYNFLLESWARTGGVFAAERCEQILTQMQSRYEEGDIHVQPNISSFKVVLMAWRHSNAPFAAYRAQRILGWMVQLYKGGKNTHAIPDSDCFDMVLQMWSRSDRKDAATNAEKLLGEMERLAEVTQSYNLKPTDLSFNAVLVALARSKNPGSWKRATEVLSFMEKLYYEEENSLVEPGNDTYRIVLGALSRSRDVDSAPMAEYILRSIEERYKLGDLTWEPKTILFNSAIGCWGKSQQTRAYRKARSILDRQLNMYIDGSESCKPDLYGFTSVLSTCASENGDSSERCKAFNVALSTYKQLVKEPEEFGKANHVTYGNLMKACARLTYPGSDKRLKWTKYFFEECKRNGQVGDMVLKYLTKATANPEEYKILMEGYKKKNMPKAWSQNVDENFQYQRGGAKNRKRAEV